MIQITAIHVKGHITVNEKVNNVDELEKLRISFTQRLKELIDGGDKELEIWFTIQTQEFSDISYPKSKKRMP